MGLTQLGITQLGITLAQSSTESRGWVPFVTPLPMWGYWWILLLPILLVVAVVYKTVKTQSLAKVPGEALKLLVYIVLFMSAAALALALLVEWR